MSLIVYNGVAWEKTPFPVEPCGRPYAEHLDKQTCG